MGMANMFNEGFRPAVSTVFTSTPQPIMPNGYPWGMLLGFNEGLCPIVFEIPTPFTQQPIPISQPGAPIPQVVVTYTSPLIHTV